MSSRMLMSQSPPLGDPAARASFRRPAALRGPRGGCFALWAVLVGWLLWNTGIASAQTSVAPLPPPLGRDAADVAPGQPLPEQILALPTVQADLDVIHRRSQLIVTRAAVRQVAIAENSLIEVVQYSPTEIAVIGMGLGSTTLTLWFENSQEPLIYLVRVIRDPSLEEQSKLDYGKLEKKIAVLFPNSKVYLFPLSGKIIVKGQARDSEEAAWILSIIRGEVINQNGSLGGPQNARDPNLPPARWNAADLASSYIVNMLTIPGDFQVMLRVRIAELNRSMLRRLGVDLEYLINDGRHVLATTLSGGAPTFRGIFEEGDISVLMSALRSNGTAKILSEPVLTVLSGHDATVLSGGEFAVPTIVGIQGVGGQQTVFRGFGVSVIVTPTVLDKDLIRMRIRPEFSEINQQNQVNGIPGLQSRRVDTTVQLREGQTIVLAGLLSHRTRTEVAGIPLLSSIPIIGPSVFSTKRSTEDETELLITVSPEIVRPMEPDEVPPYPGFEVTVPDDHLLYWKGFTQGPNDTSVNQLAPYGHGSGTAVPMGYGQFNPAPAAPGYAPVPNGGVGGYGPPPGMYGNTGAGRYGTSPLANQPQPPPAAAPAYSAPGPGRYSPPGPTAGQTPGPSAATGGARSIQDLLRNGSGSRTQQVGYSTPSFNQGRR